MTEPVGSWLRNPLAALRRSSLQRQHRRLAQRLADRNDPLARFAHQPLVDWAQRVSEGRFLVLDLETTGLDPNRDRILSLGWLRLAGGALELDTARHHLVRPDRPLDAGNVAIHGITDQAAGAGESLETALGALLDDLSGHMLVAHHVPLERAFLAAACRQLWGETPALPAIDTLSLGLRLYRQRQRTPRQDALTLAALRQEFGLPRYRAHHALSDALATAELFLAFRARQGWDARPIRALMD